MKKDSLNDKIMKLNEQRFATIVILCNVLDTEKGVSNTVKSGNPFPPFLTLPPILNPGLGLCV